MVTTNNVLVKYLQISLIHITDQLSRWFSAQNSIKVQWIMPKIDSIKVILAILLLLTCSHNYIIIFISYINLKLICINAKSQT